MGMVVVEVVEVPPSQGDLAEAEGQAGALVGARERAAAPAPQLDGTGARRAAHPQQEVEVGRRVHGVEDVGVVRDHQLCRAAPRHTGRGRGGRQRERDIEGERGRDKIEL